MTNKRKKASTIEPVILQVSYAKSLRFSSESSTMEAIESTISKAVERIHGLVGSIQAIHRIALDERTLIFACNASDADKMATALTFENLVNVVKRSTLAELKTVFPAVDLASAPAETKEYLQEAREAMDAV